MKLAKDVPLAEITLRKYEKPRELGDRELVKKFCLSMGLLQIGDSRDVIVDVLLAVLQYGPLKAGELEECVVVSREDAGVPMLGIAPSNLRRQLRRLREVFIVEKVNNTYRINENAAIIDTFEERIEQFLVPSIMKRVKEYIHEVEKIRERSTRIDQPR